MEQLKNALNTHGLDPSDFDSTLEAMDAAEPETQWTCQKGVVQYTIIKNSQTSYNIQTDQESVG